MKPETRIDIGRIHIGHIAICVEGEWLGEYWNTDSNLLITITRYCENHGKAYHKQQMTSYYTDADSAKMVYRTLEDAIIIGEATRTCERGQQ